ncbi:UNVERIFIED_CONTAM: hypothetical protein GTU68_033228 [Idotea baltica]|nr:hypothetical protein [Idotea baltica]
MQLGGSVKARPAISILAEAILSGKLKKNMRLLDASSGNAAIAYATFANALGIGVTICIPENTSPQTLIMLKALGVDLVLSSKYEGHEGAEALARELYAQGPDRYFYADQYSNEHNWRSHYKHTGMEINQQTRGKVTHFITGLGSTGTFTGIGRRLKELNPEVELIGLQPSVSDHALDGWKHLATSAKPQIYDVRLVDQLWEIKEEEVHTMMKDAAKLEGLILSPSSAANLVGALRLADTLEEGVVVTIFPDDGSKYLDLITQLHS